MSPPVVTALYAGLNALIIIWLAFEVIRVRRGKVISLGDGGDPKFNKVIRGHANAVETIPLAILLLLTAEMMGAPPVALHIAGAMLTVGRFVHGLHFTGRGPFNMRPLGMGLTLLSTGLLALGLVAHAALMVF